MKKNLNINIAVLSLLMMSLLLVGCRADNVQPAASTQEVKNIPETPYTKGPTGPPSVKGPTTPIN